MQLLILDPPLVQELGMLGILDADDVQPTRSRITIPHSGYVSVRTLHILLDIEIGDAQGRPQREVAEHLDIVASPFQGRRLGKEPFRRKGDRCGE